ncbi:trypsin-like peptidase domain-containing protein [Oculatella sp. LEGE 06141]|uniref:HhoA/HhoB/HtrA family serine endopeptidase n=1 Tax=Oculatella sp. LEGE 06141 TaxID=1828648 RepID=UPI0018825711|nr:HhoA/HhoB/HtrA family serine endopeptidase [Oculatella sp. LEGE 06141]MBE9182169.1 trypsin-like peptidase domain-containing protein [Oculatella sp. LEGE 06141]
MMNILCSDRPPQRVHPLAAGTLLLLTGLLGSCSIERFRQTSPGQPIAPQATTADPANQPTAAPIETNFVELALERVEPAVVQIEVSQTVQTQIPDAFRDPFLRRFFGDSVPNAPAERILEGIGSGFIISSDGQIVTNSHVVSDADTVMVTLSDGQVLEGRVLGDDPVSDIAVLQVEANNLPTVTLGNSDQVRRGQWAIAIGNPLGLEETVTVGVISAIERSSGDVGVPDKRLDFLQTDAAINPGNSGGPLVNAQGEVIGVNTAIIGGAQGLGFAIPINTAQNVAQQLISQGRVEYAYLGIRMVPITPRTKQRLNNSPNLNLQVDVDQGVLVVDVVPNSPAARAGIRPGDIVQQVNGQEVTNANQIQTAVDEAGIGGTLQLQIVRRNQTVAVDVQLEALPTEDS